MAASVALSPVLIPLALSLLSEQAHSPEGQETLHTLVKYLYIQAMVPLLALFFGSMLIGEEVESQMMPFLLTRPIPRSALVFGKYAAFVMVTTAIFIPAS